MTVTLDSISPINTALDDFLQANYEDILAGPALPFYPSEQYTPSIAPQSPIRFLRQEIILQILPMSKHHRVIQPPEPDASTIRQWVSAGMVWLEARIPANQLPSMAADMFFHPALWWEASPQFPLPNRMDDLPLLKHTILAAVLLLNPPGDFIERIAARLQHILLERNLPPENEARLQKWLASNQQIDTAYYPPNLRECIDLLLILPPTPPLLDQILNLLRGKYNWDAPPLHKNGQSGVYQQQTVLTETFPALAQRLLEAHRFDFDVFRLLARDHLPDVMRWATENTIKNHPTLSPALVDTLRNYRDALMEEAANSLDDARSRRLFYYVNEFRGKRWLVYAAHCAAQVRLKRPLQDRARFDHNVPDINRVIFLLSRTRTEFQPFGEEDGRTELVNKLAQYPPTALKCLLPYAGDGRWVLLEALGWQPAIPLVQTFYETYFSFTLYSEREWLTDWMTGVPESSIPEIGLVDSARVRQAAQQAGPDLTCQILELFQQARRFPRLVLLFEAALGLNDAEVLEGLEKRDLASVRAYGLLPLTGGAEEAAERRDWLENFEIASTQFSRKRRLREIAAVKCALAHLQQVEVLAGL